MTFTSAPITVKDATAANKPMAAFTDGTNNAFAHAVLDATGAIVSPATSAKQDTLQATAASILAALGNTRPTRFVAANNTVTRPADTTAYAFGDLLANSATAGSVTTALGAFAVDVAAANDTGGIITGCLLGKTGTGVVQPIFRAHVFNVDPFAAAPAAGDNGAFAPASRSGYLGSLEVTLDAVFGNGVAGVGNPTRGNFVEYAPATGTRRVWVVLEVRGAYVPAGSEVFDLQLKAI